MLHQSTHFVQIFVESLKYFREALEQDTSDGLFIDNALILIGILINLCDHDCRLRERVGELKTGNGRKAELLLKSLSDVFNYGWKCVKESSQNVRFSNLVCPFLRIKWSEDRLENCLLLNTYLALFIGCLSRDCLMNQKAFLKYLPDGRFDSVLVVLNNYAEARKLIAQDQKVSICEQTMVDETLTTVVQVIHMLESLNI